MEGPTSYNDNSAMTGKIILVTRQIEKQLHELTKSDAAGIHALTDAAGNMISYETRRQLHYLGSIRNQAAHEDDFSLTADEFNRFLMTADAVMASLKLAIPRVVQTAAGTNDPDNKTISEVKSAADYDNAYAVEKELFARIFKKIMILGYYPFVGVIQLIFLMLSAMKKQVWVVFLTIVYTCSVILAIEGWTSEVHHALLYLGVGCFVFAYICVSGMAIKTPIFRKMPKYVWLIPVVNMFYLPCRWARDLYWQKFLLGAFGVSCFVVSIITICNGYLVWSFFLLLASWACSGIGSYFWGKKA